MEQASLRYEFETALSGDITQGEAFRGVAIRIDAVSGQVKKTISARLRLGAESSALVFVHEGATLVWGEADKRWFVMPPQSVTYLRGPLTLLLSLARGVQKFEAMSWNARSVPFLTDWLERVPPRAGRGDRPRIMATMPYKPIFQTQVQRYEEASKGKPDVTEPSLFSVLYDIVPKLVRSRSRIGLAPIPFDVPPNIASLVQQVRQRPDVPWPLKEAAELVGYSPFHFSRIYKSLVGYGFHEFVDRCRTEHAVDLLCTTDTPVDVVAAASGFGTTQALRESIKEYLGLVPSELRASPEQMDVVI